LNAGGLLTYAIIPVLLGIIARARFPQLASPDLALPTILMYGLPVAVGALGLAAVFSAELSAADAALFMITTSMSQDLYKRFVAPRSSEARVLLVARVTTVIAGAVSTAIAIVSPSIIGVLSLFYTLLGVSLFVPILGGLYVRRASTREALSAIAAGVAVMVFVHMTTTGRGYGPLTPALAGILAACAAFVVVLGLPRSLDSGTRVPTA
jgi:solute:Na+ symporter, SSS family